MLSAFCGHAPSAIDSLSFPMTSPQWGGVTPRRIRLHHVKAALLMKTVPHFVEEGAVLVWQINAHIYQRNVLFIYYYYYFNNCIFEHFYHFLLTTFKTTWMTILSSIFSLSF